MANRIFAVFSAEVYVDLLDEGAEYQATVLENLL
jgi:hypothetical protein